MFYNQANRDQTTNIKEQVPTARQLNKKISV